MAELTKGGVDIRRSDVKIYFWITRGWLDDIPSVRGVDALVVGTPGRLTGNRLADTRRLLLNGQIKGAGATEALAQADFHALLSSMLTVWDPDGDPENLVVADGYRGLGVGQTATISVRTVNVIPAGEFNGFRRKYSWELECVSDPPAWVIA
jgi:hypothetical protein